MLITAVVVVLYFYFVSYYRLRRLAGIFSWPDNLSASCWQIVRKAGSDFKNVTAYIFGSSLFQICNSKSSFFNGVYQAML